MLKLGCTRVELGVQTIYNDVLAKINRGHYVEDSIEATKLLKENGLKITYHLIPGLPGSSYERDIKMFKLIFTDPRYKPDGLKIYPCIVIKGTKLYDLLKKQKYNPLELDKAVKLILEIKKFIPEYCRIMRLERDISSKEIVAGVKMTNLRQYISEIMKKNNLKCRCIRCREIKSERIGKIKYKSIKYNASNGIEYFICAETNDKLVGFCRLSLDKQAIVRELHVYGQAIGIGKIGDVQHRGFGSELMKLAEKISSENKFKKLLVISGIGVRNYYRKLNYAKEGFYMVKNL